MAAGDLEAGTDRAAEVSQLLQNVQELILPYIRAADEGGADQTVSQRQASRRQNGTFDLTGNYTPAELAEHFKTELPLVGKGREGFLQEIGSILQYSVNTWDRGFLDKLYSSNDAPGIASDLILSTLNTNTHVFNVSPALTLIEKETCRGLAALFGFRGDHVGGVSLPGGSFANYMSMLVARNYMFPKTKSEGMSALDRPLSVFTSSVSHYSISTAATQVGIGTKHVHSVRVEDDGHMNVSALRAAIDEAVTSGSKPFYVCATAGTTVTGAYDPLPAIAEVCKEYDLWMHVDGSFGGSVAFSPDLRHLVQGAELSDSIALSPHKMLGVPLTTSFLLGADMRKFYFANNIDAGYLFHNADQTSPPNGVKASVTNGQTDPLSHLPAWSQVFDMAKFTTQCGRRGDSLKLYLAWQYYGSDGFAKRINAAFAAARQLAAALERDDRVEILNGSPPSCCQVCFRYVGSSAPDRDRAGHDAEYNTRLTREIVSGLRRRGWMTDYTTSDKGEFLRVVCNRNTSEKVVESLVKAIVASGEEALQRLRSD